MLCINIATIFLLTYDLSESFTASNIIDLSNRAVVSRCTRLLVDKKCNEGSL